MNRALLIVDYTNDFVADDGLLTCGKPAQVIEDNIFNLAKEFMANNEMVIFAVDLHFENDDTHPESKLFPAHNIINTPGRELYGKLDKLYKDNSSRENVYYLNKTRYSAFAKTELYNILVVNQIEELYICGVCTDICVLHTLVDTYNLGFSAVVHENCVASFNEQGHNWALGHFKTILGARVV